MNQEAWFYIAVVLYLVSALAGMGYILSKKHFKPAIAKSLAGFGWVAQTVFLALRASAKGGLPGSNMFEALVVIVWCLFLLYRLVDFVFKVPSLVSFVMPAIAAILVLSLLLQERDAAEKIEVSNVLLVCHVVSVLVSYAAFAFGFITGLMYLIQEHQLKMKAFGNLFRTLPSLELLEQLNYRTIVFGFPVLTLSLLFGGVVASQTPDWRLDRLAVTAVVTWLVYGILFSLRMLTNKLQGKSVAFMMILGFVFVCFTFWGVSTALHGMGGA